MGKGNATVITWCIEYNKSIDKLLSDVNYTTLDQDYMGKCDRKLSKILLELKKGDEIPGLVRKWLPHTVSTELWSAAQLSPKNIPRGLPT